MRVKKLTVGIVVAIMTFSMYFLNSFLTYADDASVATAKTSKGSTGSFGIKIILFIIIIGISIIFGRITESMNKEKGYDTGFAWGFWLWVIGIIVVACRPERNNGNNSMRITEADEIAKYKELLDSGAITEEEYEVKKKQILGL